MDECRKIQKEVQPDFPFLDDVDNKAGHIFSVKSIPAIFILDKNGKVVDAVTNELMDAGLVKRLKAAFDTLK